MLFQIYNIEQKSDTEVYLYGKSPEEIGASIQTIVVKNIFSDIYFLYSEGKREELISDLKEAFKVVSVEDAVRKNMFIRSLETTLSLLKVKFSEKASLDNFESDYCEMIQTEFCSPVENIVISKRLIGPCVVEVTGKNTDFKDIRFVRMGDLANIKTCSIAVEAHNDKIVRYAYTDGKVEMHGRHVDAGSIGLEDEHFSTVEEVHSSLLSVIRTQEPDLIICHNVSLNKKISIKNRLFCDLFNFAMGTVKGRDFSIGELSKKYGVSRSKGLAGDSKAILQIFSKMNALNLAKEMSEISGYMLNRCLTNSRAERIEYTLLHELYAHGYLFPLSVACPASKYSGGLVLEPEKGFYEDIVLLLDFNSLYPSIIQEFNVCFSTVGLSDEPLGEDDGVDTAFQREDTFLPKILRSLVERRQEVKREMRKELTESQMLALDTRQKVLKLTANSIYGCLGFSHSRFCNFRMAAFITAKGRAILKDTKQIAETCGMKVIYGDTDSIMIHTKYPGRREYYESALKSVTALQNQINIKYRHIEIEVECCFSKLLLYTKKKYAGLMFDMNGSVIEAKGLEIVRRDYCRASTELSIKVLDIVLEDDELVAKTETAKGAVRSAPTNISTGDGSDVANSVAERIYNLCLEYYSGLSKRPVEDFVMSSILGKELSAYANTIGLPHINLARRLQGSGVSFKQNDVINYVIGAGHGPVSNRGFHPEENFEIDFPYYIKNQILPPLFRILALLRKVHLDKIALIFNAKPTSNARAPQRHMTFMTECCKNAQEPFDTCHKCQTVIPKSFYIRSAYLLLRSACDLYQYRAECIDCGTVYKNHFTRCYFCKKDLKIDIKNRSLDELLSNLQDTFSEFPEIIAMCKKYSAMSSYRIIDLSKYFSKEIQNYLQLQ